MSFSCVEFCTPAVNLTAASIWEAFQGRCAATEGAPPLPARLSLAHYRVPRSLPSADGVPPILTDISGGLTAVVRQGHCGIGVE